MSIQPEIETTDTPKGWLPRMWEVLFVTTRLGLTSFGGPVAHLGYFREEYVQRRKWLDEHTYADIVCPLPVSAGSRKQPGGHCSRNDYAPGCWAVLLPGLASHCPPPPRSSCSPTGSLRLT